MHGRAADLRGDLGARSIFDLLRELHFLRATGVLEVDGGEHKRRLFLRDGSLYLAGTHPLARRLGELVKALSDSTGSAAATEARVRCIELVERMARVIGDWRTGAYRFRDDPAALAMDLVGPLPTRRLLMVGATVGATPGELVARLGGERSQLVVAPETDPQDAPSDILGLGPEEYFLLERLRQPMTLAAIVAESPFDRETTHKRLVQLLAARKIRLPERGDSAAPAAPQQDSALLHSLSNRFARNLKEEPLALSPEEFRARVAELFAGLGAMTYYELLDVEPASAVELVQSKYELVARQVHPANEAAYGLTGLKPMLELLFERATQGYLVLSDPERRRQYNQSQAIDLSASQSPVPSVKSSRKTSPGSTSTGAGVGGARDFHYAIELLQLAAKLDRRSEYLLTLARVETKNPKWLDRAVDTCRAALEVEPHSAEVRFLLGEIYEQQGDLDRARAQFTAAVREDPHHLQAGAKLRNLTSPKAPRAEADNGLFGRIFRRRDS
jgi:tetratricopeptide (TPR) repeat protein